MDTYTSAEYWNSIYFDFKVICDAVMLWVYQPCSLVTQIVLCHSVQYVEVLPSYLLLYLGTMGSQSFYILISRCWHFDESEQAFLYFSFTELFLILQNSWFKKKKKKIYIYIYIHIHVSWSWIACVFLCVVLCQKLCFAKMCFLPFI